MSKAYTPECQTVLLGLLFNDNQPFSYNKHRLNIHRGAVEVTVCSSSYGLNEQNYKNVIAILQEQKS